MKFQRRDPIWRGRNTCMRNAVSSPENNKWRKATFKNYDLILYILCFVFHGKHSNKGISMTHFEENHEVKKVWLNDLSKDHLLLSPCQPTSYPARYRIFSIPSFTLFLFRPSCFPRLFSSVFGSSKILIRLQWGNIWST